MNNQELTNEERQAMIEYLKSMLDFSKHDSTGTNEMLWKTCQVALAALTAEPVPVVPDAYEIIAEAWRLMDGQNPATAEWHSAASRYLNAHRAEVLRLNTIDSTAQQYEALAGWKMVPIEPTEEMLAAYYDKSIAPISRLSVIGYRAMLEAAPKPEG